MGGSVLPQLHTEGFHNLHCVTIARRHGGQELSEEYEDLVSANDAAGSLHSGSFGLQACERRDYTKKASEVKRQAHHHLFR